MNNILDSVKETLLEGIALLKPVPAEAVDAVIESIRDMIAFDREEKDDVRWNALLSGYLPTARTFEIHCWSDEGEWIELAMRYGKDKDTGWRHGTVVGGNVTPDFREMFLTVMLHA